MKLFYAFARLFKNRAFQANALRRGHTTKSFRIWCNPGSSVKSRPKLQTKTGSPGSLQTGMIICYDEIKRCVSGQYSAQPKMAIPDSVWKIETWNQSAVETRKIPFLQVENIGGAVHRPVAEKWIWKCKKKYTFYQSSRMMLPKYRKGIFKIMSHEVEIRACFWSK